MSNQTYLQPDTAEEKTFHKRNQAIIKIIKELTKGSSMFYSDVNNSIEKVRLMRKANSNFNIKFGLHKEIA